MPEFIKTEPGEQMYLADFPRQCVCGAQKGPIVATGLSYRTAAVGTPLEASGQIYLCRLCTTRAARVLGLIKGEEHERLQNAADELAEAQRQIDERQAIIERLTANVGAAEQRESAHKAYIETLQAEITHFKAFANQMTGLAKEMVTA